MYKAFIYSLLLHVLFFVIYPGGVSTNEPNRKSEDGFLVRLQSGVAERTLNLTKPDVAEGQKSKKGFDKKIGYSSSEFDGYIDSKYLDVHPTPLHDVMLDPLEISPSAESGYIVLFLFINKHGQVDKVDVVESTISSALEEYSIHAFMDVDFNPGEIDSSFVATRMKIKIDFNR